MIFKKLTPEENTKQALYFGVAFVGHLFSLLPFFWGAVFFMAILVKSRKWFVLEGISLTAFMWGSLVVYYLTSGIESNDIFGHYFLGDAFHFELYAVTVFVAPFVFIGVYVGKMAMLYRGDSKKAVALMVAAFAIIYIAKLPVEYTQFKGNQKNSIDFGEYVMSEKSRLLIQDFAERHPELDEAEVRKLQIDIYLSNMNSCKVLGDKCPLKAKGLNRIEDVIR